MTDSEFVASPFNSPAGKSFGSSQWQVHYDISFTGTLDYDSGEVGDNGTHVVPFSLLMLADDTYFWRVRYKTAEGVWSDWSEPTSFDLVGSTSPMS